MQQLAPENGALCSNVQLKHGINLSQMGFHTAALCTTSWLLLLCVTTVPAVQLSTLIGELASAGEAELRVQLDDGVLERLLAYSRSVASFPTAVKEASQLHDLSPSQQPLRMP